MATTIEYALMAGASYRNTRPDINKFPIPVGWNMVSRNPQDNATGFEAAAFGNGTTIAGSTEIVISFAGTYDNPLNPLTNPDLQADIGLATGYGSDQLKQAVDYYLQVKAANPNATITLTGHSLGGGLASLVGVFFGVSATTFDQAPFANSAQDPSVLASLNPLNLLAPDVAANIKQHIQSETFASDTPDVAAAKTAARDAMMQQLDAFLTQRAASGGIPNSNLVTNIRVDGELLSVLPIGLYDTINATPATALAHAPTSASSSDLHSQALLSSFLQSDATSTTTATGQKQSLSQVTYKLTDLLGMIFDKNLYRFDTDKSKENFIDRMVRHEAGNAPLVGGGAVTADAMVTRFTADLWKLAQDGGMTMVESTTYSNWNNISKALTAFAMQMYYEDTANATNANKQLFTDLTTAGTGSNGIQFDMHDVSKDVAAAMDANDKVDLSKAKGYQYVVNYLDQTSLLSSEERTLIKSMLPAMRDWYVQAGASGMNASDTLNRGAFMLGGTGSDALVGGAAADLLVGNAGDDLLQGGLGNDILLVGSHPESI